MTDWFVSDTHFSHDNIIQLTNRTFSSVGEMDNAMVERWNSVVSINDTIYHLGDFTLGGINIFYSFVERLNGKIKIVPGNHDNRWLKNYVEHNDKTEVLSPLHYYEKHGINIVMCHYPLLEWRGYYRGWINIFGHCHGSRTGNGKSLDVSVDCHNFYPISLDDISEKIKNKENL